MDHIRVVRELEDRIILEFNSNNHGERTSRLVSFSRKLINGDCVHADRNEFMTNLEYLKERHFNDGLGLIISRGYLVE